MSTELWECKGGATLAQELGEGFEKDVVFERGLSFFRRVEYGLDLALILYRL